MKLLVVGATGQVGRALVHVAAPRHEVVALTRTDLDLYDEAAVRAVVAAHQPDAVLNAAAYTAVDRAEDEPDLAMQVNAHAPGWLAAACAAAAVPLVHYSTDYVFDGTATVPYREDDAPHPLGIYGQSKWLGEEAVRHRIDQHLILRVSWVFAAEGHNFVRTIYRLAQERPLLRVVADQHGSPTYAGHIAEVTLHALERCLHDSSRWGTYHYTDAPPTTWYDLAAEVLAALRQAGRTPLADLEAIPTAAYPTRAPRPDYSVLDTRRFQATFGQAPNDWQPQVQAVVKEWVSLDNLLAG